MAEHKNQIKKFTFGVLKSETALADGQLQDDLSKVLQGHCVYLPQFHCSQEDLSILQALASDLEQHEQTGLVNWSQHLKHENPDFSATFQRVLQAMADYFDVEVYASRLNFYRNGADFKPFHHDSHAYGANGKREDFTMGASFGAARELAFLHPPSGAQFSFPQKNGDVFAFTSEANKRFQHGVPKALNGQKIGPRVSIIGWGRRRSINSHNGAPGETTTEDTRHVRETEDRPFGAHASSPPSEGKNNEMQMDGKGLVSMVEGLVLEQQAKTESRRVKQESTKKRRNRVQGRPWS